MYGENMKIRVSKSELIRAIGIVQKAVSSRPSIPILKGILLVAKDQTLILTANDLKIGIETSIDCDIQSPGSVVVDSKLFGDVIRHIRDEYVSIEVKDLSVSIQNRDLDISLKGYSDQEFPDLPMLASNDSIGIKEDVFLDMLNQTLFAVADTEYNQIINGVLFQLDSEILTLAASDGYRFALRKQAVENMASISKRYVVPGSTLKEIKKLLGHDAERFIRISVDEHHIVFKMDNTRIISRLLEGEYIKYEAIMPSTFFTKVSVDTEGLLDALGINSVLAEKVNSSVILSVHKDHIEIRSRSEVGKISKRVPARVEGDPLTIGFNIRYLTEGIKANNEATTRISFVKGSKSPGVITSRNQYQYLLSPVLVSEIES
ncbi:DNA polymerase III subunit beta [Acidaminobacter sp. JC074]|nr:DNA polymerase III subunit beta [Acidaminobacter sp. JC074]